MEKESKAEKKDERGGENTVKRGPSRCCVVFLPVRRIKERGKELSLAKKERKEKVCNQKVDNGMVPKHKQGLGGSLVNALMHVALIDRSDWLDRLGGVTKLGLF